MDHAEAEARPVGYRWVVFVVLAIAYLLVYFHRLCPAVVALDLKRDLAASAAMLGLLGSAYFYPYALMQLPSGLLSDSWGPRRSTTVFLCLAGLGSVLFGLAGSAWVAVLSRGLVGIGVALVFVPTMKILTRWFKREEFARMTGILMALGGVGAYTAADPLAWLSAWLGWRGSFIAIGVGTLALAAAVWFLVKNSPEDMGYPPVDKSLPPAAPVKWPELKKALLLVVKTGRFWPLGLWFFFTLGVFFSFGGLWGGPYLMQMHGLTKSQAGGVLSMLAVAMIVGSPLLSWLSDQVVRSRRRLLIGAAVVLVLLNIPLAADPMAFSVGGLYIWFFVLSLCSSAIVVIGFTTGKELFPVEIAGTSVGLVNLFPFLGGAVAQPVVGLVLEMGGRQGNFQADDYQRMFILYVVFGVVALISALFTKETFPGKA